MQGKKGGICSMIGVILKCSTSLFDRVWQFQCQINGCRICLCSYAVHFDISFTILILAYILPFQKRKVWDTFRIFTELGGDSLRNGRYSVKSGYNPLTRDILHNDKFYAGDWNDVWRVLAPHKAKNLSWGICWGCILTRVKSLQRHVPCPSNYHWFDSNFEDNWHAFGVTLSMSVGIGLGLDCKASYCPGWRDSYCYRISFWYLQVLK